MQSTADGMSYLESEKVIHRNLRMASLLIDIYGKLKISDYGWATPTDIKKERSTNIMLQTKKLQELEFYRFILNSIRGTT